MCSGVGDGNWMEIGSFDTGLTYPDNTPCQSDQPQVKGAISVTDES